MLNIGVNCVVIDLVDYKAEQKKIDKLEARIAALEGMLSVTVGYDGCPKVRLNLEPLRDIIVSRLGESEFAGSFVVQTAYGLSMDGNWGIFSEIEKEEEGEEVNNEHS